MPLQLRRGTTAERLSIVPLPGEPILDTDLNAIFIGNGSTAGGISAITGITSEDAQDIVGQMFVNGQHDGLIFTYGSTQDAAGRIDARLDLSSYDGEFAASAFRGSLYANDSTLLVNGVDGSINLDGTVKGDIIPDANEAYDLGSNANRFKDLYLSGTSLFLGSAQITATGSAVNLPAGSTVDGVSIGTGSGTGDGVVAGSNYNINIVGDDSTLIVDSDLKIITGNLLGDVKGSVFADDSTVLVDGVGGVLRGTLIGNVTGTLTGNVVGEVNGDIFTTTIDSDDSSEITVVPSLRGLSDIIAENDLVGRLRTSQILSDGDISIAPSGVIFIGSTSRNQNGTVYIVSDTYTNTFGNGFTFAQHHEQADAINFNFYRTRGNGISPLPLSNGDDLADIGFWAWNGSAIVASASIEVEVEGTPGGGQVPARIRFATNNGSNIATRAQLSSLGVWECDSIKAITPSTPLTLSSIPVLPTFADESAANTSIGGSPANGMMYYDSGSNAIKGYVNGSWVSLS